LARLLTPDSGRIFGHEISDPSTKSYWCSVKYQGQKGGSPPDGLDQFGMFEKEEITLFSQLCMIMSI